MGRLFRQHRVLLLSIVLGVGLIAWLLLARRSRAKTRASKEPGYSDSSQ
jgi:hypothetical protein